MTPVAVEATIQHIETVRPEISAGLQAERRSTLGQFMTPATVARYMASLFSMPSDCQIRLLDPGAGLGALSAAFIHRWRQQAVSGADLKVTAYEVDGELCKHLERHLAGCLNEDGAGASAVHQTVAAKVQPYDFIQAAANPLEFGVRTDFTHAIINPPYKKINSDSMHRMWLRMCGVETVNLYSAFIALALQMLLNGGELVAIIPRSFCNGPYYRPFRDFMLRLAAIEHIHLFASRTKAFKDDNVLQENVILKLVRGRKQGAVTVSCCVDGTFGDYSEHICGFAEIVKPSDPEKFIHIPQVERTLADAPPPQFNNSLADLGLEVSTGPIVDFRLKAQLRKEPDADSAPLLYPCHLEGGRVSWPLAASKKPNAIALNAVTRRWLYPSGCYTLVRRFSSKEEKRRIVAAVVQPDDLGISDFIGFENHLNVFHSSKRGIPAELAYGLCSYLNSTALDQEFRAFNGHTQVNATDLRSLKYPDVRALRQLGLWLMRTGNANQSQIDAKIRELA